MNFLEWVANRQIEEAARHAYARDEVAPADPKQGDIVITNAKGFMKTLIVKSSGALINKGKSNIGRQGVSTASVAGLKDGKPVVQSTSYDSKGPWVVPIEQLLDVTPAFDDGNVLLSQLDTRQGVFVWNKPRSKNYNTQQDVKDMWTMWWQQVARPQAAETGGDNLETQAIRGKVFGDTEGIKQNQRNLGDSQRKQNASEVVALINGFKSGKAIGGVTYQTLMNIMKGMVEDPYDVKWLRKNGFEDIVDTLHDSGLSSVVAGEENGPPNVGNLEDPGQPQQSDFEKMFNAPQQQQPGTISTDPAALQARGQATGGHQQPQPDLMDLIKQQQQQLRAWHDPWKYHQDSKVYNYYD